uniref:Pectinesterase n=1 Tax=Wollemia nobilis TaxID=56998 RepID=A0A0C9RIW0_9CONI
MDPLIENGDQTVLSRKAKSRKRVAIISAASIVLIGITICVVIAVVALNSSKEERVPAAELDDPIENFCSATLYPESCRASLSPYLKGLSRKRPMDLFHIALTVAVKEANKAFALASGLFKQAEDHAVRMALQDCVELMDITHDQIDGTISLFKRVEMKALTGQQFGDVKAWLSAAITNMETCYDGILEKSDGIAQSQMLSSVYRAKVLASNSLAVLVKIIGADHSEKTGSNFGEIDEGFPSWVTAADRRLLRSSPNDVEANVVVAADGSGDFKTITEAINKAPNKSNERYVIKVKKGTYEENVEVGKKKLNILLVGEGMEDTIITGSRNVVDNATTFNSATVAAVGMGFMAQDIAFINTAGPHKHQAVALRVGADQSVLYRCKIAGYQDTLYVHSLRQFYRECLVLGTVDFIFGNAAVVLQNCTLLPRKPGASQKNAITAQGRTDPNQNTGISIQGCNISADSDLVPVKSSFPTYLGRPWKNYSRTVYMQSYLDDVINPAGWLEWSGDFALSTLYYGEYMNTGPGAGTESRVTWPGYHVINSSAEASQFTVGEFIQGNDWLLTAGVEYTDGLTN